MRSGKVEKRGQKRGRGRGARLACKVVRLYADQRRNQ